MRTQELVVAVTIACITISSPLSGQQHQPAGKPDHMQHRFDDPAKFAKSFDDPRRDQWQMPSRVIDALGLKSGMAVADIGAGTGYFSMRLARVSPGLSVYRSTSNRRWSSASRIAPPARSWGNVTAVLAGP